jgi:hypothetical protein
MLKASRLRQKSETVFQATILYSLTVTYFGFVSILHFLRWAGSPSAWQEPFPGGAYSVNCHPAVSWIN